MTGIASSSLPFICWWLIKHVQKSLTVDLLISLGGARSRRCTCEDVCEGLVHLTDGTLYLLTDLDIRYKKIYMEELQVETNEDYDRGKNTEIRCKRKNFGNTMTRYIL